MSGAESSQTSHEASVLPGPASQQALPTPSGSGETLADKQQPTSVDSAGSASDRDACERFIESVHDYVREYIRLADQKAAFLFTGATALLAFLYKTGVSARWRSPVMTWNLLDIATFLAVVALAVSVVLALLVVMPRTSGSRRGVVFWKAIAEFQTGRHYSDEVRMLSAATLSQIKAEHCFDLAKVCRQKYRMLRGAMWVGGIGLAAAVVVFVFA